MYTTIILKKEDIKILEDVIMKLKNKLGYKLPRATLIRILILYADAHPDEIADFIKMIK